MRNLKYLLFIIPFLFINNVFALEFDVSSKITSPNSPTLSRYSGLEIYNSGTNNVYAVGTRYNGQLSRIIFNLPVPSDIGTCFSTNVDYKVILNMATDDWRNKFGNVSVKPYSSYSTNWSNGKVTYVSYRKIYFTFKIPSSDTTCYDFVYIDLPSTNISSTAFTGVSNWNLSSVKLDDPTFTSGGSSGGGSSGATNQDVINSSNKNTQDIINNNDTNTSNIIENNNQNTQDIINNNDLSTINSNRNNFDTTDKNCGMLYKYDMSKGIGFNSNGSEYNSDTMYYTSDYINLSGATKIVLEGFSSTNSGHIIIYDSSKNYLDYWGVRNQTITLPSGSYYFRIATTIPSGRVFKDSGCTSKIDDISDTINNPNVDNNTGTGFFDDFTSQDFGLSQIITIPLNTIQSLTSKSCVPLQVPIPFTNSNISLPCMSEIYETKFPSIYNLWKIVSFGIVAYLIAIDIFHIVKGFKDPESDKVEVLDL